MVSKVRWWPATIIIIVMVDFGMCLSTNCTVSSHGKSTSFDFSPSNSPLDTIKIVKLGENGQMDEEFLLYLNDSQPAFKFRKSFNNRTTFSFNAGTKMYSIRLDNVTLDDQGRYKFEIHDDHQVYTSCVAVLGPPTTSTSTLMLAAAPKVSMGFCTVIVVTIMAIIVK